MESLISTNEESDKKPLNIGLLGDESSEKEKLMSKFVLLNSPQFQENEPKNEEEKEEELSIFHNIIHTIEMHGEKLKMKFWDNPSTDEFLSPSIKIAQGILLFYSVKNRKSYEKIQKDLSKIIELGRFDIPIIVIGNHKNTTEREVTYDEAKSWADNFGLRFYETSLEKDGSIKAILQDIGEQLLFQECIFSANNSMIIKDDVIDDEANLEENLNIGSLIESKNKEEEKKGKTEKKEKNEKKEKIKKRTNSVSTLNVDNILGKNYSSSNILESNSEKNNNNNKKRKINLINKQNSKNNLFKNNSSTNFKKIKPKINSNLNNNIYNNKYNKDAYKTENNENNNKTKPNLNSGNKITNFLNYSKMSIINKTKNLFKKNSTNNLNKTLISNHSKKHSVNTLILSNSSSDMHSYLKKTALTKNREKEVKEKMIKIEKESQSISAQREREGLELKKKKILEEKENYLKKIKEDKILQKEKEKRKKEEEIQIVKNNYDKLKQEKELINQEKKIEKEKDKLNKIALKQSEKERYNKRIEELNKEREKEIGNLKIKKEKEKDKIKDKNNISPNKHKRESTLFNLGLNNKSKSESLNIINKSRRGSIRINKEREIINKEKEKELKEKITSIKIGNDYTEKEKTKEDLKQNFINYQNTQDIYRCLKCNSIPKILFNENNQEIEILCDNSHLNNSHYNIISYQNFQTNSLTNSLYENTFCYFCNKTLNKLEQNDMIYYCPICQFYFCTKDESIHIKQKHQNENDIKNKYKSIISKKNNTKRKDSTELDINIKSKSQIFAKKLSLRNSFTKQDLRKSELKIQEEKKIIQKEKEFVKIPIYLLDTFCKCHDEMFNSYCLTCNKNICNKCKNGIHKEHHIEQFENIMPDEEEINKKKLELDIIKKNLSKINDYFIALIEAIKCRFERLYKSKQKEIEIKEKIIADYEKVKYNYNSIMNLKNLNLNSKKNFINSTNNTSWIERLNLIFEYLNCSLISENNNIFKDINDASKYINERTYSYNEEIKNIFKLDENNIALINDKNEIKIFSIDNLEEKIKYNIIKEEEKISDFIQLKNGELAFCGNEQIKTINFDIYNKKITINNIIIEKNNFFNSLIELNNNYLISAGTSNKIQLWNKNKNNLYKCIYNIDDIEINSLYNIDNFSFIGYSYINKKLKKYIISGKREIISSCELNNILFSPNKKCLMLYDNYLLINYEEKNKFGTMIINVDKFEILSKISNNVPLYFINYLENDKIITINEKGFIQKWNYSIEENLLYECDSIKIDNNSTSNNVLNTIFEIKKRKLLLIYQNKIELYTKKIISS